MSNAEGLPETAPLQCCILPIALPALRLVDASRYRRRIGAVGGCSENNAIGMVICITPVAVSNSQNGIDSSMQRCEEFHLHEISPALKSWMRTLRVYTEDAVCAIFNQ